MTSLESYSPSVVLFRFAIAQRDRAEAKSQIYNPDIDTRNRLRDSVIATIILGHAAMESELSWLTVLHGQTKREWPTEALKSINEIAAVQERPIVNDFPTNLISRFQKISAWRNFLQHRDELSLNNLLRLVPSAEVESLDFTLAEEVINVADEFFAFLSQSTGSQRVGPSQLLWVNPTELC